MPQRLFRNPENMRNGLFRMPPALPDTLTEVMKERKRSFRRSVSRFYFVKNESSVKRIFMRFHRSHAFAAMCPRMPFRRSRQASALRHERGRAVRDQCNGTVKESVCLMKS